MIALTRLLVEPFYRLIYGRPIADALPPVEDGSQGEGGRRQALVVVADGVGGLDLCGTALRYVLAAEGLDYAIHVLPWGHGFGRWHADLTNVANRDLKAGVLAQAIRRFRSGQPHDPVFLVGKSGGSGVVVKALEQLGESMVERAILLAPALSPEYDLTGSLRAVSKEMVVFWSPWDVFILGAGTRVFGTADRIRTAGAGLVGFRIPETSGATVSDSNGQYAKLRQVRWVPRMAASGYLGGHLGPDSPVFLKNYILPLLRTETDRVC
jgi:pimeloyl-ACP methyl ester carboxylesterase